MRGAGFLPAASAFCRIGSHRVVVARVVSGTMLECTTPLHVEPALLPVEVTLNDQDYSSDEVLFEYQPDAHLVELAPPRGPTEGGTFVNVTGSGFSRRSATLAYLYVRFNLTAVPVVWVSATELHCSAAPSPTPTPPARPSG